MLAPERRFSFAIGRALGVVIVTLHGSVDDATRCELSHLFEDLIDGQGNMALLVDLGDVATVDASGLRALAAANERARRHGGRLFLGRPRPEVLEALRSAGLDQLVARAPRPGVIDAHAVSPVAAESTRGTERGLQAARRQPSRVFDRVDQPRSTVRST